MGQSLKIRCFDGVTTGILNRREMGFKFHQTTNRKWLHCMHDLVLAVKTIQNKMVIQQLDPLNLPRNGCSLVPGTPYQTSAGHRLALRYWHVVDVWAIGARGTQRQSVAPTWAKRQWKVLIHLIFNCKSCWIVWDDQNGIITSYRKDIWGFVGQTSKSLEMW